MVRKPTELVMSKLKALPGDTNVILRVVLLKRFFAYTYIYIYIFNFDGYLQEGREQQTVGG